MSLNNIRKYRKEKGLTLKALSSKLGISAGYLCHLEKGSRENPSIELMKKISEELEKSISEIFFIDEN